MKAYIDSDVLIWHLRGERKALNLIKRLRDKEQYDLWIGAMQRAEDYWRTLLMVNPPTDWYWQTSTHYLAKHARLKKQWRVASKIF